jgi:hypothetical protein
LVKITVLGISQSIGSRITLTDIIAIFDTEIRWSQCDEITINRIGRVEACTGIFHSHQTMTINSSYLGSSACSLLGKISHLVPSSRRNILLFGNADGSHFIRDGWVTGRIEHVRIGIRRSRKILVHDRVEIGCHVQSPIVGWGFISPAQALSKTKIPLVLRLKGFCNIVIGGG